MFRLRPASLALLCPFTNTPLCSAPTPTIRPFLFPRKGLSSLAPLRLPRTLIACPTPLPAFAIGMGMGWDGAEVQTGGEDFVWSTRCSVLDATKACAAIRLHNRLMVVAVRIGSDRLGLCGCAAESDRNRLREKSGNWDSGSGRALLTRRRVFQRPIPAPPAT